MIPYVMSVDKGESLLWFEQMVLRRLDSMASDQKDHYEFCTTWFKHLDGQIETTQEYIADMYYGPST